MPIQVQTSEGQAARQSKTDAGTNPIANLTLAQALNYLSTNVTDLASAKTYLGHLTKVVFVMAAVLKQKGE